MVNHQQFNWLWYTGDETISWAERWFLFSLKSGGKKLTPTKVSLPFLQNVQLYESTECCILLYKGAYITCSPCHPDLSKVLNPGAVQQALNRLHSPSLARLQLTVWRLLSTFPLCWPMTALYFNLPCVILKPLMIWWRKTSLHVIAILWLFFMVAAQLVAIFRGVVKRSF